MNEPSMRETHRAVSAVEAGMPAGGAAAADCPGKSAIERSRGRLVLGGILFALAFGLVAFRLVDVAILQNAGEPRSARSVAAGEQTTARADIVDRNGVLLATSLATASLYANPREVLDAASAARRLAAVLPDVTEAQILERLRLDRSFVWLRRNLTPRQEYAVNRLGIPGFYFQSEERRVYPHGGLAAHIVGMTGIDNEGLAGAEMSLDAELREGREPVALSIDIRVQHILREELAASMKRFSATGAAGIVMDVATGEVVAMVSLPDFDPNLVNDADPDARFNRATLGVYEMGSTFKLLTAAMALDSGAASMRHSYDATKPIRIARFMISDFKPENRWLSVSEVLIHSSNIGAAKMALDVGSERQRGYFERLGMLRRTGIELPEDADPLVPSPWREINTMTIGFGHGIAVSPVHLVNGISTLVNGGVLHKPTIRKVGDGAVSGTQVFSQATSDRMRWLMREVVAQGTGSKADTAAYPVGGKTGTAEKAGGHGYRRKSLVSSFVAAVPIAEPRYVVLALLDEPKGIKETFGYATGGWVAAPVIKQVILRMAPLLGIEPVPEKSDEPAWRGQVVEASARVGTRR